MRYLWLRQLSTHPSVYRQAVVFSFSSGFPPHGSLITLYQRVKIPGQTLATTGFVAISIYRTKILMKQAPFNSESAEMPVTSPQEVHPPTFSFSAS